MKILFTGGGTAGHIIPIVAIARELRKISPQNNLKLFFIGPKDDFGAVLLSQENIKVKTVLAGKIRRYLDWKTAWHNFVDVAVKIPIGIIQSFFHIFFISPDLVFSKGGFGSIPVVIAAKMLFVPVFLHESDVAPGAANKFLSDLAFKIFVSFPKTEYFPREKMVLVGNPTRKELMDSQKEEAKKFFNLNSEKPVILILGGSQGSQRINDGILDILPQLLKDFELIHQSGENNYQTIRGESKAVMKTEEEPFYHLFAFLKEPELRRAYAVADLIISRAGAGSIFEIAAVAKPSILIPLPEAAQNHQLKNAYAYQESGSCLVIEENNFTPSLFLEKLKTLFINPEQLRLMADKAKAFSKIEAAKTIADYLNQYLNEK
ncbi:MAG: undecaprenyldiphospho-muramoylpentapeptide beta-N-acetylglucosaminyltransferase [Candidatus Nealsonbacteria bacterium]|nr:undecaprenyldiphospho-muramoylpentapeptide beta-N-acetylglucosaminyltransferase [Candidatus Nealsonbacteria bacterium]